MNPTMCRVCGCDIREFERCDRCRLAVSTICECCSAVMSVQSHVHAIR